MKRLLDLKAAAEYMSVSTRTVERMAANETIERVQLPGVRKMLFRIDDLDRIAKENRTVPVNVPGSRHILAVVGGTRRKR